jgi:aquaporin Z
MRKESAEPSSDRDRPRDRSEISTLRRLLAAALGTFLLTSVSIAPDVFSAGLGVDVPDAVRAVVPAMMVALVIYSMGDVSGAHINPAVTIAFALRRAFPWFRVPGYVGAQILGACVAAAVFRGRFGTAGHLGTSRPYVDTGTALVVEMALSALLILVILNVSTRESLVGPGAAIPVAMVLAVDGLLAGKVSGASMNPARSLGPALVGGSMEQVWLYVVAPLAGALIAAALTYGVHGRYTGAEEQAAQGEG